MAETQSPVVDGKEFVDQDSLERRQSIEQVREIEIGGELVIEDEVIGSIAGIAAREVEGVAQLGRFSIRRAMSERMASADQHGRGVRVEHGRRQAVVDLTLSVTYGYSIPTLVEELRKNVAARILQMCGLVAKQINVHVVGLEYEEGKDDRSSRWELD